MTHVVFTSDINKDFCPPGPTSKMSMSSSKLPMLTPFKRTRNLSIVSATPDTLIVEGYGLADAGGVPKPFEILRGDELLNETSCDWTPVCAIAGLLSPWRRITRS